MADDCDALEAALLAAKAVDRPADAARSCAATSATRRPTYTDDHEAHGNPFTAEDVTAHQGGDGHPRRAVLGARRARRGVPRARRRARRRRVTSSGAKRSTRSTPTTGRVGRGAGAAPASPGWEDVAADVRAGREDRHPRQAIEKAFDAVARRLARPGRPAPPTSPATPAPSSPSQPPQIAEHPGGRQIYYGVREHAHGRGDGRHGRCTAASCPSAARSSCSSTTCARRCAWPSLIAGQGRASCGQPRLGRRRRGRPDAPAGRAPRHAAGDPRPAGHPPGRRQRDRRRVAGRRRPRRPDGARAQPPGHRRCAPTARPSSAAPASCVPPSDARSS